MAKIVVYTRQQCIYCDSTKVLLASYGADFETIDCTWSTDLVKEMMDKSGRTSFPQIFLDDRHIGGFDDLNNQLLMGTLQAEELRA
jgi:glutaredoxin 3